jgi:hypothetical protein
MLLEYTHAGHARILWSSFGPQYLTPSLIHHVHTFLHTMQEGRGGERAVDKLRVRLVRLLVLATVSPTALAVARALRTCVCPTGSRLLLSKSDRQTERWQAHLRSIGQPEQRPVEGLVVHAQLGTPGQTFSAYTTNGGVLLNKKKIWSAGTGDRAEGRATGKKKEKKTDANHMLPPRAVEMAKLNKAGVCKLFSGMLVQHAVSAFVMREGSRKWSSFLTRQRRRVCAAPRAAPR